jgi:hypothetical protein
MVRTEAFSAITPAAHLLRTKLQTCGVVLAPALVNTADQKGMPFEITKPVRMNGLRVYLNPAGADGFGGLEVFYSRREDGPYYRWRYEAELGQWCFSRARLSLLTRRALCIACWENVPTALQARLGEHYLD